jgi:hypothetical protein
MYRKIITTSDQNQIGVDDGLPQVLIDEKSFNSKQEYLKFDQFFGFFALMTRPINALPDFNVKVDKAHLRPGGKLTDFIGSAIPSFPYIVSDKAKKIIEEVNGKGIHFFPVTIQSSKGDTFANYFIMYVLRNESDAINYKNSVLVEDPYDTPQKVLKISSAEDLEGVTDENPLAAFTKLCFYKDKLINSDFIASSTGGNYVSDKFIDKLTNNNISGLSFLQADIIIE